MPASHPIVPRVRFRDVPGYPGYCVGSDGSAWSCKGFGVGEPGDTWFRLKPDCPENGYLRVTLSRDGKARRFLLHLLVLELFDGPCPPGMECRHLDGDRGNNRLTNLTWGTKIENRGDQFLHGTAREGETHPQAKLSDADVAAIIERLRAGDTLASVARDFGVSYPLIAMIGRNKTRKSVPRKGFILGPRPPGRPRKALP